MGASLSEISLKVDRDNCWVCDGFVARVNKKINVVSHEVSMFRVYSVIVEGRTGFM